jgi:hypothetical protein
MIYYTIFTGTLKTSLDIFILGMDIYRRGPMQLNYIEWFYNYKQEINKAFNIKEVLSIQIFLILFLKQPDLIHDFKDFYEGR